MIITINQLALYMGVHRQTASKYYKTYLQILQTKRKKLTVSDLAKIEDKTETQVLECLGLA